MTNEEFCELYSSFFGEKLVHPEQLTLVQFDGPDLKEFIEHCMDLQSKLNQSTVISPSPIIEGKTKSNVKNNTQKGRLAPPPPPINR
jgi:hypothetical protein